MGTHKKGKEAERNGNMVSPTHTLSLNVLLNFLANLFMSVVLTEW